MNFKHDFSTVIFVFQFILTSTITSHWNCLYLKKIHQLTKFRIIIQQEELLQKPMPKAILNFLSMKKKMKVLFYSEKFQTQRTR